MPEVIEVRMFRDFISKFTKGKIVKDVEIKQGRYKNHEPFEGFKELKAIFPARISAVSNKGKLLWMTIKNASGDKIHLANTTGLYGGWTHETAKERISFPAHLNNPYDAYQIAALKHKNIAFRLDNGSTLWYYDQLSFGTFATFSDDELQKRLDKIGPDIMEDEGSASTFAKSLEKQTTQNKQIGVVLLDQRILAGIGNYLRADSLWMSRISPFRKVRDLEASEVTKIWNSARKLAWAKYDYQEGLKRGIIRPSEKYPCHYNRDFFVYMETADPQGRVVKTKPLYEGSQMRTIHYVEDYQK